MHTNFNFKPCSLFTLALHCCFSFLLHFHHSFPFRFHHSFLPQCPPVYFPWHMINCFFQVDEHYKRSFPTVPYFSTNCLITNMVSTVLFFRHESNLDVTDGNCTLNSSFKNFFQNLHCMLQHLQASII